MLPPKQQLNNRLYNPTVKASWNSLLLLPVYVGVRNSLQAASPQAFRDPLASLAFILGYNLILCGRIALSVNDFHGQIDRNSID